MLNSILVHFINFSSFGSIISCVTSRYIYSSIILLDDIAMRTRERVVECPVYIFTASCRMHFCSFFSPPRSYRLTNGLGRGHRGGRRLKSRRKERRENGSRGCEIERRRAGGDEGDLRDKEAARDLVPKCQFLMPQPADYLSRRGRACISVKSRSLHAERGAPDEERTRN